MSRNKYNGRTATKTTIDTNSLVPKLLAIIICLAYVIVSGDIKIGTVIPICDKVNMGNSL